MLSNRIVALLQQKVFTSSNASRYIDRYIRFINWCYTLDFKDYGTMYKHHIFPQSWGGDDASDNIISLPARYHFVAHHILFKTKDVDMCCAFWRMTHSKKYGKLNSYVYALLANQHAKNQSILVGRPVYNLTTKQLFCSAYEASRSLGMKESAVSLAIFQNQRCGGYYWQYKDVVDKSSFELELQYYQQFSEFNKQERQVVNLNTGEIFDSLAQVASTYNLNKLSYLSNTIKKRRKFRGYYWQYKDVVDQTSIDDELQYCIINASKNDQRKSVVNLNTGQTFESATYADMSCGYKINTISRAITRGHRAGGFYWQYKDVVDRSSIKKELQLFESGFYKEYYKTRLKNQKYNSAKQHNRSVINLTTGEIFESIKQAAKKYNVETSRITNAIKRVNKSIGCYWQYKDIVDQSSIEKELNRCLDIENTRPKRNVKVVNLNTGEMYNSCYAASIAVGLKSTDAIRNAILKNIKAAGCFWQFAEVLQYCTQEEALQVCIDKQNAKKSIKKKTGKKVKCVEDDLMFDSLLEASRYYQFGKGGAQKISQAIKNNKCYNKKHWIFV